MINVGDHVILEDLDNHYGQVIYASSDMVTVEFTNGDIVDFPADVLVPCNSFDHNVFEVWEDYNGEDEIFEF